MTVEYIDPIVIDPDDDRYDDDDTYVYDPEEHRCWGPFFNEDDADAFIESDKYLQSWCCLTGKPEESFVNIEVYPPEAYHGDTRWRK